jgi:hypothetical protein
MTPLLGAILDIANNLLGRIFPDPAQKAEAQLKVMQLAQAGELAELESFTKIALAQAGIDQAEAASADKFVSRWRPFIGWVCGCGLTYQFVLRPFLEFGAKLAGSAAVPPALDMTTLMTLLFGMLGLGVYRTAEKIKGVS